MAYHTAADVELRVYDLSRGAAAAMSEALVGMPLEGVWHTGLLVHGVEFFYGGGIQHALPADVERAFGMKPSKTINLGYTKKTASEIYRWCEENRAKYSEASYDLLLNNCNHFTNAAAQFLFDKHPGDFAIPLEILLQNEVIAQNCRGRILLDIITRFTKQIKQVESAGEGAEAGGAPGIQGGNTNAVTEVLDGAFGGGMADFLRTGRPPAGPLPTAPSPPVADPTNLAGVFSTDPDDFELRIRALYEDGNVPAPLKTVALRKLRDIATNVLQSPTIDKYKSVYPFSRSFRESLAKVPHAVAALQAAGFHLAMDKDQRECYRYDGTLDAQALQRLSAARALLSALVERPPPLQNARVDAALLAD